MERINILMVADGVRISASAKISMALSTAICGDMFNFYIGVPSDQMFKIEEKDLLNLRCEVFSFPHEEFLVSGKEYRIINKINAMVNAPFNRGILIDTDTIFTSPFPEKYVIRHVPCAVPEQNPFPNDSMDLWRDIYKIFDLQLPSTLVRHGSGKYGVPYFNAGLVSSPNVKDFATTWKDACQTLRSHEFPRMNPYLDQLALPVAITMMNKKPIGNDNILPKTFNHNIFHWQNIERRDISDTVMLHHHDRISMVRMLLGRKFDNAMEIFPSIAKLIPEMALREFNKYSNQFPSGQ